MSRPPNLSSKPSNLHSGHYDATSSSRKSSTSVVELQEMHRGRLINRDLTFPLIEPPEEDIKIERQVSLPLIILGIATVAFLVILLSIMTGTNTQMVGYRVSDYYISPKGNMYSVALKPINQQITIPLHGISKTLTLLRNLNMSIQCYGLNHLRVSIRDTDSQRWEIPEEYPYSYATGSEFCDYRDLDVVFDIHQKPFSFKIIRKSTNEPLLNTENFPLIFSKYYMELTTKMPSFDFYGFGERSDKLQMTPGSYTIFPKDQPDTVENGKPGNNLYGQQPVYLMREASGNYHLVLLRNSNAMEIQIGDDQSLKYQVVGGIFDFQIFLGSKDPESVVETYHQYLGKWTMPPFWSLGFHQSKWGYNNVKALNDVMQGYQDYQIPLDVIWSDIDYMMGYLTFTVNSKSFPPEALKASLAKFDKRWIPIVDAGIGAYETTENLAYRRGKEMDIFLKDKAGKASESSVWPGYTVFADFFHPQAEEYWLEMLHELDNKIPFDGIWLDMNEIATFCDGPCNGLSTIYDKIPFMPGNISLQHKTVDLEAVHYGNIKEFDAHSLFNLLQQKATYSYLILKGGKIFLQFFFGTFLKTPTKFFTKS